MAAHRYWRFKVNSSWGASYAAIAALQLRVTAASANLSITGNGTASASSVYSGTYPASDAFDANTTTTRWASIITSTFPGEWVKWDFGIGNSQDIGHMTIVNSTAETTANVNTGVLQYSDDDSAWVDWIFVSGNSSAAGITNLWPYIPPATITLDIPVGAPVLEMHDGATHDLPVAAPALDMYSGATFDLSVPAPTLLAYGPWRFDLAVPAPTLEMSGGTGILNTIDIQVGAPVLDMLFAARFDNQVPAPTIDFSVTTTITIRVDVPVPAPTLEFTATKGESISLNLSVPAPTLEAKGGAFVAGVIPAPTADIAITTGGLFSLDADVPAPTIECTISADGTISIDVDVPVPSVGPYGVIEGEIPAPRLEMVITAVVTITYEAYAVNLKPTNKARVHEVTHYTAMPFSGMVHWQGNWYGWGPAGLYLIGGDTDAGEPIPWDWHTAVTNFGSRQQKAVRETFLHGRLGPNAVASVSIGEAADVTYAAVIERGRNAQAHRIKYGKGLKAEYWSFGLSDVTGSAMEVDAMQHEPKPLSRKI